MTRKDDAGKPRYDLIPHIAEEMVAKVLTYGATKYGADNWRTVPDARVRYYSAARRHLSAWFGGEELDADTGLPHLAHATCCLMFLMEPPASVAHEQCLNYAWCDYSCKAPAPHIARCEHRSTGTENNNARCIWKAQHGGNHTYAT